MTISFTLVAVIAVVAVLAPMAIGAARPQLHRLQAMVPQRLGWQEREIDGAHSAIRAHDVMPRGFDRLRRQ